MLALLCGDAVSAGLSESEVPFEISADSIAYYEARQLYVAEGDVRVAQGGRRLEADWAAFSLLSRLGAASGRVRLEDGGQLVRAEFMVFDVDRLQGSLFEGDIDTGEGGFLIQARELVKTGDVEYEAREGMITACRCPPETLLTPWRVRSKRAQVELGGYGQARNSTVDVMGVPALWLPWMIYPVKTDRETGLLLPDFAYGGRNGFQVGVPFFWAARPELNVTVTPRYVETRGFKPDLDLEYVLGQHSGGRFYGSYVSDESYGDPLLPPHVEDRWGISFQHDQALPRGWRARADVKLVSDNLYLGDFDDYGRYRADLFLRSTAFAFRHFGEPGRVGVVGSMLYADDIQYGAEEDRDRSLLHRWPDLSLRVLPGRQAWLDRLGLVSAADASYAYFHSLDDPRGVFPGAAVGAGGFFLDTGLDPAPRANEGDGLFQAGEPMLDSGHRLVLHPRLARPLRLVGLLDLYPELGYSQTLYRSRRQGFAERGIFSARADLRGRLRGRLDWLGLSGTGHLLEPFASWALVRPRAQADNPVFVPPSPIPQRRLRQLALDNRLLDPSDRVRAAQVLAVGFDNRLRGARSGAGPTRVLAEFRLSFEHDFETAGGQQFVLDGRGFPRDWLQSDFNLVWNTRAGEIDEGLFGATLYLPSWRFFSNATLGTRYRFLRHVPAILEETLPGSVDQLDATAGLRLFGVLQLNYGVSYSLADRQRISNGGTVIYASRCRCWAIGVDIREESGREVYYGIRYSLTGLGRSRGSPFAVGNELAPLLER